MQIPITIMASNVITPIETHGIIPIACTDTQSPLDTTTLLWDTASFFTATYTAPEIVHSVMEKVTALMIEFTKKQVEHLKDTWIRPGHNALSAQGGKGLSISDDNMVMVSPKHYFQYSVHYNEMLSDEFNGLAVHTCGEVSRQLPVLLKTRGLQMIDVAFSPELDPNPNIYPELFRDSMKGTGIILHARVGSDWPQLLPRLYHPDLKLALVVPLPGSDEPRDKNIRLLERVTNSL